MNAKQIVIETRLEEAYGFVVTYDSPGGTKFFYKKQGHSGGSWTQKEDEAFTTHSKGEAEQIVQGLSRTPGMADRVDIQTLGPGMAGGPGGVPMPRTSASFQHYGR